MRLGGGTRGARCRERGGWGSARQKIVFCFFPPAWSKIFLNRGAHPPALFFPPTPPPVNEIVLIFGWAVIAAPTFGPAPCTTLRTPFGKPASCAISQSKYAVIGVSSLGLAMPV